MEQGIFAVGHALGLSRRHTAYPPQNRVTHVPLLPINFYKNQGVFSKTLFKRKVEPCRRKASVR